MWHVLRVNLFKDIGYWPVNVHNTDSSVTAPNDRMKTILFILPKIKCGSMGEK